MNIERLRDECVDLLERVQKLSGSMPFVALPGHKTGGDIERCEQ
jgi:hypothetical protein